MPVLYKANHFRMTPFKGITAEPATILMQVISGENVLTVMMDVRYGAKQVKKGAWVRSWVVI